MSSEVYIEPVKTEFSTPLSQIGVGDPDLTYRVGLRSKAGVPPKNNSTADIATCWQPSSIIVALTIIIILSVIFIFYMYTNPATRNLFFGIDNPRSVDDSRGVDATSDSNNVYFILALGLWTITIVYLAFKIDRPSDTPVKIFGKYRTPSVGIDDTQYDIFILLGNIGFLLLSLMFIVYVDNFFFSILFAIAALLILFVWRPRPSFIILAISEVALITIFCLKFRSRCYGEGCN